MKIVAHDGNFLDNHHEGKSIFSMKTHVQPMPTVRGLVSIPANISL